MDRAIVFAGGDAVADGAAAELPDDALIIAADSGLHSAMTLGLSADIVIGDMDSVDPAALAVAEARGAKVDRHDVDKDATDLELALHRALAEGVTDVIVLGGRGSDRLDHFIANALLLASFPELQLEWRLGSTRLVPVRSFYRLEGRPGDIVSLLPIGGPASGVHTTGLQWPLDGDSLAPGSTRGVSNVLEATEATVAVESGVLLLIHEPPEKGRA